MESTACRTYPVISWTKDPDVCADHIVFSRLTMDITSRESISEAQNIIANKEGRLHILVNK